MRTDYRNNKVIPSPDGKWELFYASGTRGNVVRSNGNGGYLARGFYIRNVKTRELRGPYKSMSTAVMSR